MGKFSVDTVPISIRLPESQLKYLKKMSHYVSIEQDVDLSYVDLIRNAIEQIYPMPLNPDEKNAN